MAPVFVRGYHIELLQELELRRLTSLALREHAETISRALSVPGTFSLKPPEHYEELINWVLSVQRLHLEPLIVQRNDGISTLARSRSANSLLSPDKSFPLARLSVTGLIVSESHSRLALLLSKQQPLLAAAIFREVNGGVQKLHSGLYGINLDVAQRQLSEDIYAQLACGRLGSFWAYRHMFQNFSVAVGPLAFAGSIPCFCYKIVYPSRWAYLAEFSWVTVFFALKESEMRTVTGSLAYEEVAVSSPLLPGQAIGEPSVGVYTPSTSAEYALIGDVRLPMSTELELRRLDRLSLQDRSNLLYRTLGPGVVATPPPETYDEMIFWIMRVQCAHLEPLRSVSCSAPLAVTCDSVVIADGTRLPVYKEIELRMMDRKALREHVVLLYTKLGADRIAFGMPGLEEDLVAWVLRVQRLHLLPYCDTLPPRCVESTTVTSPLGEKVETKTYTDFNGDEIMTKVFTDRFGDETKTTTVRDRSPSAKARLGFDWASTSCASPIGTSNGSRRSAVDDLLTDRLRSAKSFGADKFGPLTNSVLRGDDALWRRSVNGLAR